MLVSGLAVLISFLNIFEKPTTHRRHIHVIQQLFRLPILVYVLYKLYYFFEAPLKRVSESPLTLVILLGLLIGYYFYKQKDNGMKII